MEDHNHEEHNHGEQTEIQPTQDNTVIEDHGGHEGHDHSGLDGLWEVMFGFEHVVAEFFWNAVFLLVGFGVSRAIALRKIHKYIDEKHGISHKKSEY